MPPTETELVARVILSVSGRYIDSSRVTRSVGPLKSGSVTVVIALVSGWRRARPVPSVSQSVRYTDRIRRWTRPIIAIHKYHQIFSIVSAPIRQYPPYIGNQPLILQLYCRKRFRRYYLILAVTSSLPIVLFTLRTRVCCWNDRARLRRLAERPRTGIGPAVPARRERIATGRILAHEVIDQGWRGRMTFVVPFDGSNLAEAALVGAVEYGTALQEDIAAVTVVPERKGYARQKGWIEEGRSVRCRGSRRVPSRTGSGLAPDACSNTSAFGSSCRKRNSPNTSNDWARAHDRASSSSAVRTSAAS